VHHGQVADVAVGKDDLVDLQLADQPVQVGLGVDRDTLRIQLACQLGRVEPALDVGNLGGGECDHLIAVVSPKEHVEVVEISPGRAHDQDALWGIGLCRH